MRWKKQLLILFVAGCFIFSFCTEREGLETTKNGQLRYVPLECLTCVL